MTSEVRCESKKHAEIVEGCLEVVCSSRFCGSEPGVVVVHRFSLPDGRMIHTRKYRDPSRQRRN